MRVLVVEDNEVVSELVHAGFTAAGWEVERAVTGQAAIEKLEQGEYSAAVLDIELPDIDGFAVLSAIRTRPRHLPVVMLTGRTGPREVVTGLSAGADDYVRKPFDMEELIARVVAVVRRTGSPAQEVLQFGDVAFDRLARDATVNGRRLRLTPKDQLFLELLLIHAGERVSREELLRKVWRITFDPGSNLMDAHIARLRAKLKSAGCNVQIVTHRNEGFALKLIP